LTKKGWSESFEAEEEFNNGRSKCGDPKETVFRILRGCHRSVTPCYQKITALLNICNTCRYNSNWSWNKNEERYVCK
jgi:hypothetical protein